MSSDRLDPAKVAEDYMNAMTPRAKAAVWGDLALSFLGWAEPDPNVLYVTAKAAAHEARLAQDETTRLRPPHPLCPVCLGVAAGHTCCPPVEEPRS